MRKYRWESNFTGAVYRTLIGAIAATFVDWANFPKCRSIRAFSYKRLR